MFTAHGKYVEELVTHIRNYLEDESMEPIPACVLDHFEELNSILQTINQKKEEFASTVDKAIIAALPKGEIVTGHSKKGGTYRYYNKPLGWYDETFKYYFYVEFKFENDDPWKICVQRTLKCYPRQNACVLNAFMENLNKTAEHKAHVEYHRYWVHKWDIKPHGNVFSNEWMQSAKEGIVQAILLAYKEQAEIVEAFKKTI